MLQGSWACVPQLLKPTSLEPVFCNKRQRWWQWEAGTLHWRVAPTHSKAPAKQWRPSAAKKMTCTCIYIVRKRRLYTWTSPDGQNWNQIDYILCSQRWKSSIQSAKTKPGDDCGSDHELLIAKFRLKLKKVGKTTRPFRHDLNQVSNDYTVEVWNRFKGLDLIGRVPDELWTEVCDINRKQGSRPSPKKRNARKQNGCLRRPY